jgi:hypothetical protein
MPPAFWTTLASHAEMWSGSSKAAVDETRARLRKLSSKSSLDAVERELLKSLEADLSAPPRPSNPAVDVFGRIKPGVTRTQAETEVRAIAVAVASEHGGGGSGRRPEVRLQSLDAYDDDSIVVTAVLVTTLGFVIFLACANVTNLLLASAASRRREIGTVWRLVPRAGASPVSC